MRRVLPSREVPYQVVDPWLLLDDGELEALAPGQFPAHPHRGFEIVTYVLEGAFRQEDSEGHTGAVRAGGLLRTTAGRGIWHGEGAGGGPAGPLHALQLWINLPRAQKQIPPATQAVQAEEIPEQTVGAARVRVLVGEGSPTHLQTPALYLDATLPAGGATDLAVPAGFQGFAYLLDGSGAFGANGLQAGERQVVVLGQAAQAGARRPSRSAPGPEACASCSPRGGRSARRRAGTARTSTSVSRRRTPQAPQGRTCRQVAPAAVASVASVASVAAAAQGSRSRCRAPRAAPPLALEPRRPGERASATRGAAQPGGWPPRPGRARRRCDGRMIAWTEVAEPEEQRT